MSDRLTTGIVAATLTAVDRTGAPSIGPTVLHCCDLLDAGCRSIVVLGTTGEANSFSIEERQSVLEGILGGGISASALIVGTGCCAVGDTARLTKHAMSLGVRRVLLLPPFYYKDVSDEGIVDAFVRAVDTIADDRLRLYLYRIPQVSGVDIGPAVIEALLQRFPGILAGIKDSSVAWDSTAQLCSRFGASIDVLVGSERNLLAALDAGACGCVTATANAYAQLICELYERRHEGAIASTLQTRAGSARTLIEKFPMIAALKALLARRTGDERWRAVRPPLTPLSPAQSEMLLRALSPVLA